MQNHDSIVCVRRRPMVDACELRHLAEHYGDPIRCSYDVKAGGSILEYRWRKDSDRRAEVIFAIQGPGEQIWLHTKHRYERPLFRLPTGGVDLDESIIDALLREVEEEAGVAVKIERFVALLEYQFYQASPQKREIRAGHADLNGSAGHLDACQCGIVLQSPTERTSHQCAIDYHGARELVARQSAANQDFVNQDSGNQDSINREVESTAPRAKFASYLFLLKNLEGRLIAHNNDEVAEFKPIMPSQLIQVAADLRNIMGDRREWGHWRGLSHDVLYEAMHRRG